MPDPSFAVSLGLCPCGNGNNLDGFPLNSIRIFHGEAGLVLCPDVPGQNTPREHVGSDCLLFCRYRRKKIDGQLGISTC